MSFFNGRRQKGKGEMGISNGSGTVHEPVGVHTGFGVLFMRHCRGLFMKLSTIHNGWVLLSGHEEFFFNGKRSKGKREMGISNESGNVHEPVDVHTGFGGTVHETL
jgi:hypothetical protein